MTRTHDPGVLPTGDGKLRKRLWHWRETMGWTRDQAARTIGIANPTLQKYEYNKAGGPVSNEALLKWVLSLEVPAHMYDVLASLYLPGMISIKTGSWPPAYQPGYQVLMDLLPIPALLLATPDSDVIYANAAARQVVPWLAPAEVGQERATNLVIASITDPRARARWTNWEELVHRAVFLLKERGVGTCDERIAEIREACKDSAEFAHFWNTPLTDKQLYNNSTLSRHPDTGQVQEYQTWTFRNIYPDLAGGELSVMVPVTGLGLPSYMHIPPAGRPDPELLREQLQLGDRRIRGALRGWREGLSLTRRQAAKLIGIANPTLEKYEYAKETKGIRQDTLVRWTQGLDVPPRVAEMIAAHFLPGLVSIRTGAWPADFHPAYQLVLDAFPFPAMILATPAQDVLAANAEARRLIPWLTPAPEGAATPTNLVVAMCTDPRARAMSPAWEEWAHASVLIMLEQGAGLIDERIAEIREACKDSEAFARFATQPLLEATNVMRNVASYIDPDTGEILEFETWSFNNIYPDPGGGQLLLSVPVRGQSTRPNLTLLTEVPEP